MLSSDEVSLLQDYYSKANSFLILLSPQHSFDQVAAALSLHLLLQNQKKAVEVICPQPMRVEFNTLVGVDQVKTTLGNHTLRVSFPYEASEVENVSYNLDKEMGQFHLLIKPPKGHRPPDPTQVEYSHVGVDADMVFLIGVQDWADILKFYESEEQELKNANSVAFNHQRSTFANANLEAQQHSSYCECLYDMARQLELPLSSDIATNLFAGASQATNKFQTPRVSAETFDFCAKLLRAGARRIKTASATPQQKQEVSGLAEAFAKQLNKNDDKLQASSSEEKNKDTDNTPDKPSQYTPMAR